MVNINDLYDAYTFQVCKALPVTVATISKNRNIFIALRLLDEEFDLEPLSDIIVALNDSNSSL